MIAPSPKTSPALMMRLFVAIADALKMRAAWRRELTEFSLESEILHTTPCNEGLRRSMRPPSMQTNPEKNRGARWKQVAKGILLGRGNIVPLDRLILTKKHAWCKFLRVLP